MLLLLLLLLMMMTTMMMMMMSGGLKSGAILTMTLSTRLLTNGVNVK